MQMSYPDDRILFLTKDVHDLVHGHFEPLRNYRRIDWNYDLNIKDRTFGRAPFPYLNPSACRIISGK